MSATGSVRGFMEFDDLCRGCQGYSDNLAQLFDTCDIEKGHRHKISFKQALKRLRNQVKESLHQIENDSFRKVTDFTIGKTFVKHRNGVTFHPMKKTTWSLGGGINGRWQSYKAEGYDGLVVIGCIERDLIPDDVMRFNKSLKMNQQIYTLGLEQALIQYYTLYKPDKRLRNKSFDIGNLSEGGYKGGIVYVAYKLEPEKGLSDDDDSELIKENVNSEETPRAFERLRLELLKIGLNFDHTPSLDIDSFFIACCTQLDRLGIPQRNYASLRQILVEQMKLFSLFITKEKLKFHNFTRENWNEYLDRLSNGKENVCDLFIESMAKMLDKTIVIYSLSYPNGIDSASINDQANNGPSLLIAREKSNFISLAKVEDEKRTIKPADIKPALKQNKRPAETDSLDQGQTTITTPESTKIEKTDEVNIELHSVKRAKLQLDKLSEDVIESTAAAIKIPATRRQSATNQIDVLTAPSLSLNISTLTNQPIKPTSTETRSDQQHATGLNVGETQNSTNQEKQRNKTKMKMTKEEKTLILNSYINQRIKSDWDLLAETVFNERRHQLKGPTINHYEKILTRGDLKGRIKTFVQDVRNGKRNKEEDPSVKALMEQIVKHKN